MASDVHCRVPWGNGGIFVGHPSWTSCGCSLDGDESYLMDKASELIWLDSDCADLLEAVW